MSEFKYMRFENKQRLWSICYELCKSCGLCMEKCPVNCLKWSQLNKGIYGAPGVEIDIDKCISCSACQMICPERAIRISKISEKTKENQF